ncbi:hypothetical protein ABK040_012316 [Willaertia magna]
MVDYSRKSNLIFNYSNKKKQFFNTFSFLNIDTQTTNSSNIVNTATTLNSFTKSSSLPQLFMLYDGDCPLCIIEINYMKKKNSPSIYYLNVANSVIDPISNYQINSSDTLQSNNDNINPIVFERIKSLSRVKILEEMHIVDGEGNVFNGPTAYLKLLERNGFNKLVFIFSLPIIRTLFEKGYYWFARNRHWLGKPFRKEQQVVCENGSCNIPKRRK